MAQGDLTRIRSNISGLNILRALRDVNKNVQLHQLRLATGKRINNAGDDPAGLSIATKIESRNRALQQVFNNIGEAKNLLNTAEGGLQEINNILVELQSKIEQSANDTLGTDERKAISGFMVKLRDEIDSISNEVTFNGVKLLGSTTTFTFQTGETSQTSFATSSYDVSSGLGMTNLAALTANDTITADNYLTYLAEVTAAMSTISSGLTEVGSLFNRFSVKESIISVQQANTEATVSRIMDADMAHEQLELTKAQVIQQSTVAMLAQANLNSQSILQLFG
jgi:flagellin